MLIEIITRRSLELIFYFFVLFFVEHQKKKSQETCLVEQELLANINVSYNPAFDVFIKNISILPLIYQVI